MHISLKSWDLLVSSVVVSAFFGSNSAVCRFNSLSVLHFGSASASATFHPFSPGVTEPFLLSFHPALLQSGGFSPAKLRAMLRGLEKQQRNNGEDTSPEANDSGELDDRSKSPTIKLFIHDLIFYHLLSTSSLILNTLNFLK